MPSVKSLELKQAVVSEIKDKCENAKSIVLFDYRGLTDKEIKDLRIKLKENDSEYKVYKNTLLRLAFKDMKLSEEEKKDLTNQLKNLAGGLIGKK